MIKWKGDKVSFSPYPLLPKTLILMPFNEYICMKKLGLKGVSGLSCFEEVCIQSQDLKRCMHCVPTCQVAEWQGTKGMQRRKGASMEFVSTVEWLSVGGEECIKTQRKRRDHFPTMMSCGQERESVCTPSSALWMRENIDLFWRPWTGKATWERRAWDHMSRVWWWGNTCLIPWRAYGIVCPLLLSHSLPWSAFAMWQHLSISNSITW